MWPRDLPWDTPFSSKMKCEVVVFVALLHYSTVCGQVLLTANTALDGALCPGSVRFTCVATQLTGLRWRFNNTEPDIVQYDIDSAVQSPATLLSGGTVELVSVENVVNLTFADLNSTLTVGISVLRDDVVRSISCGSPANTTVLDIPMLSVQAPPPQPVYSCDITEGVPGSVELTLNWDPSFTTQYAVDMYCVRATGGFCAERQCVPTDTPYTCSGVVAGLEHRLTVTAVNCGSQEGDGNMFTVLPRVPMMSGVCTSVPVYEQSSGGLIRIQSTWTAPNDPPAVKPGVSQNVTGYYLMYSPDSGESVSADVCSPEGQCSYSTSGSFQGSEVTVTVAAENLVRRGQPVTCTPEIGSENAIVAVTVFTATEPAVVVCEFLTELTSPAQCEVCYGIDPPCQNLTCFSSPAAADGRAVVELPPLEAGVRYCYTVTASIAGATKALVEGTFSTVCDVGELRNSSLDGSDAILAPQCNSASDEGSVSVPNGVVCYTGTSAGSTATYQCDGRHTVFSAEDTRTCQSDGNWNGAVQTCVFVGLRGWHVALTVLGVVSWVAAAALTVVALVLILCARRPASLFWWHWLYIVLLVVNAVLLLVSAVMWIVFGAVLDNPRGHAAELTDYLVLRDALCGVTFALSLVALLLVIAAVVLVQVIQRNRRTYAVPKTEERVFEDLTYAGQQEEDEFRMSEVIQRMVAAKELQPMDTVELVPLSKEERESRARKEAARKKDGSEDVYDTTNHKATESTGATGGGEYSALQHGQGGRDKGRGKQPSTSKLQPQTGEYQKPDQGVGGAAKSKKNAPPPPPPPPSEEYDTLETAGLPQTTTTTAAAGGAEYGKLNPPPGDGKKGKAGRGKAHPPPTAAEYSQLDTTSRSTEGSTAQGVVEYAEPNTGARYAAQTSQYPLYM